MGRGMSAGWSVELAPLLNCGALTLSSRLCLFHLGCVPDVGRLDDVQRTGGHHGGAFG